jgi:transcriptional regulator with XRE-family HTH domain
MIGPIGYPEVRPSEGACVEMGDVSPIHHPRLDAALLAFGLWVREGRKNALLSQEMLAARAGCSQATISRVEGGLLRGMSLARAVLILDALDALPHMDRAIESLARESALLELEDLRAFDKRAGTLLDELSPDEFLRRWIG